MSEDQGFHSFGLTTLTQSSKVSSQIWCQYLAWVSEPDFPGSSLGFYTCCLHQELVSPSTFEQFFPKSTSSHPHLREVINNPMNMAPCLPMPNTLLKVKCEDRAMMKCKETLVARKGIQKGVKVRFKQNLKKIK